MKTFTKPMVQRIGREVDWKISPKYIKQIVETRVKVLRLFWEKAPFEACLNLHQKTPSPQNLIIRISGRLSPENRIVAFFHEVFHIVYIDNGIPVEGLSMRAFDLLEERCEICANNFVNSFPEIAETLFERSFGFLPDDFAIFN